MALSPHADLLAKQSTDIQPALQCIFKSKDGVTVADYSFDPTVTTNRLEYIEHHEDAGSRDTPPDDYGIIFLRNNDLAVPDLRECYVDIGWGANTASGLRYSAAPRLWVKYQDEISGTTQDNNIPPKDKLKVMLRLEGVWRHFLNRQVLQIGTAPLYKDDYGVLKDKTIYGVAEYMLETLLTAWTGYTFTLDALGTQDDGLISSFIPFPTAYEPDGTTLINYINPSSPHSFETYGDVLNGIVKLYTKCHLKVKPSLGFQFVYPQSSDAVNETYYSDQAHYFYENRNVKVVPSANHCIVYANEEGGWNITGNAYDPDDYDTSVFPPTLKTNKTEYLYTQALAGITTQLAADNIAAVLLARAKTEEFGGRYVVPMDFRTELFDRVEIQDFRGI